MAYGDHCGLVAHFLRSLTDDPMDALDELDRTTSYIHPNQTRNESLAACLVVHQVTRVENGQLSSEPTGPNLPMIWRTSTVPRDRDSGVLPFMPQCRCIAICC